MKNGKFRGFMCRKFLVNFLLTLGSCSFIILFFAIGKLFSFRSGISNKDFTALIVILIAALLIYAFRLAILKFIDR